MAVAVLAAERTPLPVVAVAVAVRVKQLRYFRYLLHQAGPLP